MTDSMVSFIVVKPATGIRMLTENTSFLFMFPMLAFDDFLDKLCIINNRFLNPCRTGLSYKP